jgi:hypothetical protein
MRNLTAIARCWLSWGPAYVSFDVRSTAAKR